MAKGVRLDHAGISALLKSAEMHRMVQDAAEELAGKVREQGLEVGAIEGNTQIPLPVTTEVATTDRAHARVVLAHPAGIAAEAKHGVLTKAASALGVEVKGS